MQRFLALLALVMVLMVGTAGMGSATTIGFDLPPLTSPDLPYPPEISGLTSMTWDDTDYSAGHLWCTNFAKDSAISFSSPTYVNNFQINGMPTTIYDPSDFTFGPLTIVALDAGGTQIWTVTLSNLSEHTDLGDFSEGWLTVDVNTADVSKLVFYSANPLDLEKYPLTGVNPDGPMMFPSVDNLVIDEVDAVPIPGSVWLVLSGLLGLAGLRRKLTC